MTRDLFAFKCLPQTDDLDDALCLVAGQLQMALEEIAQISFVAPEARVLRIEHLLPQS